MRRYTAPADACRCVATIRLRGKNLGSDDFARCMRRATVGNLCAQHAAKAARSVAASNAAAPVEGGS